MRHFLLILFLGVSCFTLQAQDDSEYDPNYEFPKSVGADFKVTAGIGLGLDYGGIGGKLVLTPIPNLSLFGGIGYNLDQAGYNGGVIVRILPESKVSPYITGMYGYNGVIVIDRYGSKEGKTYYGPTFGAGIELNVGDNGNYWNFGFGIPSRSSEYKSAIDALMNEPGISLEEASPVTISVGFHIAL